MYGIKLLQLLRPLARRTEGQDLIEYALLVGVISIGIIAAIGGLGSRVTQMYATTAAALNDPPPSSGPGNAGSPGPGNSGNRGNPGGNPGNSGGGPGNSGRGRGGG